MSDSTKPPRVDQSPTNPEDVASGCPFCTIATSFSPIDPLDLSSAEWNPDKLVPPSYVLLSTEHVVAFLDIAPLTRGHVLVAPRKHRVKIGDLKPSEMAEIGRMLPILARSILKTILPDIPHEEADYNVVQNNGPGAAQVVPHVHFHIIPRPPLNYQSTSQPRHPSSSASSPPSPSQPQPAPQTPTTQSRYPPSTPPTGMTRSQIQFGRGWREDLDDDDATTLIQEMRRNIADAWAADFAPSPRADSGIQRFTGGSHEAAWIEGGGGLVRNLQRRGVWDGTDGDTGEGDARRRGKSKL